MVEAGAKKIQTPFAIQAVQGFMAGAYVALGAFFANIIESLFKSDNNVAFEKLYGGAVFPIGLIAIFLTGANLFTGNCMYIVPPMISGSFGADDNTKPTTVRLRSLAFLVFSWICNYAGAWFTVYLIAYEGQWANSSDFQSFVIGNAKSKIGLEFYVAMLRGVGANWLVCLAWWQALSTKETLSKMFAIWLPVFTFTAIGFEHSIANMFYIQIGWLVQYKNENDLGKVFEFGDIFSKNLLPVTIGNFLGGAVFLGLVPYLSYHRAIYGNGSTSTVASPLKRSGYGNSSSDDVDLFIPRDNDTVDEHSWPMMPTPKKNSSGLKNRYGLVN